MITRKNLLLSSFIGLEALILRCSNRILEGQRGTIVDETKNTLSIESEDGKLRKVQKTSCLFRFTCEDGTHEVVDGKKICFRPHERPKKV